MISIEYERDLALLKGHKVVKWSIKNSMNLHADKFEVISLKANSYDHYNKRLNLIS